MDDASGWTDKGVGDVIDIHHYPEPLSPMPEATRAAVLGEFGGLGLKIDGHGWVQDNWGYQDMQDKKELLDLYRKYYGDIRLFVKVPGLSASIYTQITDVETESNGLMTYDREVLKMDREELAKINKIE